MLGDFNNLTWGVALLVTCLIICLGKWGFFGWYTAYKPAILGKNTCLFCWGFWLSACMILVYFAVEGFAPVLCLAPFASAALTRFLLSNIKV